MTELKEKLSEWRSSRRIERVFHAIEKEAETWKDSLNNQNKVWATELEKFAVTQKKEVNVKPRIR
jgi:hypothetical protein